jgi:hypothetical protein
MTEAQRFFEELDSDEASLRLKVETVFGRHGHGPKARPVKADPEDDGTEAWCTAAEELAKEISPRECATIFLVGLDYFTPWTRSLRTD